MKILNNLCFMCGESTSDGIILNGEKICRACEEKIVKTTVDDLAYNRHKDEIKIILFDKHAKKWIVYTQTFIRERYLLWKKVYL